MQRRRVGGSGLHVGRLGLGTMTWGRDTKMDDARPLLSAFVAAGGSLVDTAAAYGNGEAERMIGKLIRTEVRRDDLVLATKGGFGLRDGRRIVDTSARAMLEDLRGSLRRLGTDHIDLWQVHAWGDAPLAETLAAIDQAVTAGDVRYAGLSNFVGWQTANAVTWQRAFPGRAPLVSAQVEYSLLARRAEVEVLPCLRHFDVGFFPWSPMGRGVLTGKYRTGIPRGSRGATEHFGWYVEPYLEQRSRAVVEGVAKAADGLGMTPLQVALLWVRDAPGVTAPLLGARTKAQLDEYLACEEMTLPDQIAQALDDISGGPNAGRSEESVGG
ncbi:aldo/keto reductase [Nigerium massiliense]|uniref:aldo/keto reductase n=1 Tax=Nigerium massiliense TaxID=1522317 RepID=UPI00058E09D1|nr:aldo/keto reductase [Nigerium massiliense]